MGITTSSLEEMGDMVVSAFGDYKQAIVAELFDNLMETTPQKTGTLNYNWRFIRGNSPGSFKQPNDGTNWPDPPRPSENMRIGVKWDYISLYNNSEYIVIVNNGEGGNQNNQNFIQKALAMTDARF